MARLYVTGDGAWGVIEEDRFAIVACDNFSASDWQNLDEASNGDKLSVAVTTAIVNAETPVPFWDDIPFLLDQVDDRLTELSFAESIVDIREAEARLRNLVADIRLGLGL